MNKKFLAVFGVLLLCTASLPALADGMPFRETKPTPILTPLDKALKQMETKEQPMDVTQPEMAAEPPAAATSAAGVLPNSSFFGLSVGVYDPLNHGKAATFFNAEWQPDLKLAGFLQPLLGGMVTTRGSLLGYGGFGAPIKLGENMQLMPSLALGLYKKGGGYDLEKTLVVRTGAELSYIFKDESRIGMNFHVIGNGTSTNRSDRTSILGVSYTMPLGIPSKTTEQTLAIKK